MDGKQIITDHDLLIRIETKVDAFVKAQSDHEARLRSLESDKDQLHGSITTIKTFASIATLLSFIASAVAAWVILFR